MVLHRDTGGIEHRLFQDIVEYFHPGDCLVINNSKVFAARLFGKRKPTGGKVEVFLLKRFDDVHWEALVKPGRKLLPGTEVDFGEDFSCKIGERTEVGGRMVEFQFEGNIDELIDKYGHIPLPPYISRKDEVLDRERYQTIYAAVKGAVAAPTAGFHFTEKLLSALKGKGVKIAPITLHPSLGTFRPITVQNPIEHKMEAEYFNLPENSAVKINNALKDKHRIFAVGTTSVRTIEKTAFETDKGIYLVKPMSGYTDIYIYPPYKFKVVKALITNFHLPKSTLLFLVSALAGRENILNAYGEAKKHNYRFYSYGDAMLII